MIEGDCIVTPDGEPYRLQKNMLVPKPDWAEHDANGAGAAVRHDPGNKAIGVYEVSQPRFVVHPGDWPLEWPNDYRSYMAVRADSLDDAFAKIGHRLTAGEYVSSPDGKDYRFENGSLIQDRNEWVEVPPERRAEAIAEVRSVIDHNLNVMETMQAARKPPEGDIAARWRQRLSEDFGGNRPHAATRETIENVVRMWQKITSNNAREQGREPEPPAGNTPRHDYGR
jgi:hypothetical protein